MSLTGTDDTPGYLVREFRTDGDGWYNYFGWPTDPDSPFRFTPSGTNVDDLVYGKLGKPRLVPWDDPTPNYGRHTIEYRAIDPSGNIGTASSFAVTLIPPPPACTTTLTGRVAAPLMVRSGVTCLSSATVAGPVTVRAGREPGGDRLDGVRPADRDRCERGGTVAQHGLRPGDDHGHDGGRDPDRRHGPRPADPVRQPRRAGPGGGRRDGVWPADLHGKHRRPRRTSAPRTRCTAPEPASAQPSEE